MNVTTVQISTDTRKKLGSFRDYPRETYDEIIHKMMVVFEKIRNEGELSEETLGDIREAERQYSGGKGISTKELLKKLEA
ncbi:hypothetical protein HZC09_02330 [Candidatus Micrarchaeota archaeon]|nr:hypothetical protein [Candidatus Micrarchaeota archaeon]